VHLRDMEPLQSPNRVSVIQSRIREYILRNGLRPGDKLPTEAELSNALHVGRTAIRETFRSLEALGIVEARQGFGRVVRDFNFDAILNNLIYGLAFHGDSIYLIHEIRKALESYFTERSVRNLTEADVEELSSLVERMKQRTTAGIVFVEEDHEFHRLLFSRCGNKLALQLFEIAWSVREHYFGRDQWYAEVPLQIVAGEHAGILQAIKERDADKARQLILAHHQSMEQWFLGRGKK